MLLGKKGEMGKFVDRYNENLPREKYLLSISKILSQSLGLHPAAIVITT
jgi:hypothetical protein